MDMMIKTLDKIIKEKDYIQYKMQLCIYEQEIEDEYYRLGFMRFPKLTHTERLNIVIDMMQKREDVETKKYIEYLEKETRRKKAKKNINKHPIIPYSMQTIAFKVNVVIKRYLRSQKICNVWKETAEDVLESVNWNLFYNLD